jgi:hypothetical protein
VYRPDKVSESYLRRLEARRRNHNKTILSNQTLGNPSELEREFYFGPAYLSQWTSKEKSSLVFSEVYSRNMVLVLGLVALEGSSRPAPHYT